MTHSGSCVLIYTDMIAEGVCSFKIVSRCVNGKGE
jgi:hypothetical protein